MLAPLFTTFLGALTRWRFDLYLKKRGGNQTFVNAHGDEIGAVVAVGVGGVVLLRNLYVHSVVFGVFGYLVAEAVRDSLIEI